MCSVIDDETEEINVLNHDIAVLDLNNTICKKCVQHKADVVLRKKDPYCQNCFISGVVHKFRSSLGKTKLIRNGDRVLIGVSGDAATCVLLDLIRSGLKESTHKKLRFQPVVLYIKDGVITNHSLEEQNKYKHFVHQLLKNEDFPLYTTSLCDIFKSTSKCSTFQDDIEINTDLELEIKTLFASVKSLTAKKDLLKKLKQKLLLSCAEELQCSFIFLAETATKLAANLISCVSLGGGSHLSSDVGFCDSRANIKILRPMRDFTSEDLDLYIKINNIQFVPHSSLVNIDNPYASIQSLTRKFVSDLQENFPATISTILRTGDKIENKSNSSEEDTCVMCLSPLDIEQLPCSAHEATAYSRMISNTQLGACKSQDTGDGNQEKSCENCICKSTNELCLTQSEVEQHLCYNCQLILREIKDITPLLPSLTSSVRLKQSQQQMKNEIKDYLL